MNEQQDYEERHEKWARKELERAITAWKKDRTEWLDRALRFAIALNAGGLATGLALIGTRLERGVPATVLGGLLSFLLGLCGAAFVSVASYKRAAKKVSHYEGLEFEAYDEPGMPVSILIDGRQPTPDDSSYFLPLSGVLYFAIGAFVVGVLLYVVGLWSVIGRVLPN